MPVKNNFKESFSKRIQKSKDFIVQVVSLHLSFESPGNYAHKFISD